MAGLSKEQRLKIGVKTFDRLFRETPEVPWQPETTETSHVVVFLDKVN